MKTLRSLPAQAALALAVAGCCFAISFLPRPGPTVSFWGFYFLTICAVFLVDAVVGAAAIALALFGSTLALQLNPPQGRPITAWTLFIADVFFCGTAVLVLVLSLRLRRQVRDATRAAENILPVRGIAGPGHLYARMVDLAPDGVVAVDSTGRIVVFNQQAEASFGYTRDEILGGSLDDLLPPEQRAHHAELVTEYLREPQRRTHRGADMDLLARRKDGTTFPAEIALAPIERPDGRLLVKATVRDVTWRRELEESVRQERVQREVAEEMVLERDTFLSLAAHELKTPLTSLVGYSEVLRDALSKRRAQMALDEEQERAARQVAHTSLVLTRQAHKMAILVDKLLDVGRLGSGKLSLDLGSLDLVQIAQDATELVSHIHPGRTVQLVAPQTGKLVIVGDAVRLEQVLVNLLDNAFKFSAPPNQARLELHQEGSGALIVVSDAGQGIALDQREAVFERFYQLEQRSMRGSGLGLGLHLSRAIVELHGGRISVHDGPDGCGVSIVITLPGS